MKGGRQPLSVTWLVLIFVGAFVGVVAGQLVELAIRGTVANQKIGVGGIVGGLVGALLGNFLAGRIKRPK